MTGPRTPDARGERAPEQTNATERSQLTTASGGREEPSIALVWRLEVPEADLRVAALTDGQEQRVLEDLAANEHRLDEAVARLRALLRGLGEAA